MLMRREQARRNSPTRASWGGGWASCLVNRTVQLTSPLRCSTQRPRWPSLQGLTRDGAPVGFREQTGIAPLACDLDRLVGMTHLISEGVEPVALRPQRQGSVSLWV